MSIQNFLYRQKQRLIIRTSSDLLKRHVATINLIEKKVEINEEGCTIIELGLFIPKSFGFIFEPRTFELLMINARELKGTYRIVDGKLLFHFSKCTVEITSRSELFIIHEIFLQKCYQFLLPQDTMVRVVDIGMNVGLASLFFAGLPYVIGVHGYEPFAPTFQQALRNFNHNPDLTHKIEPNNFGLGERKESIEVPYDSTNKGVNASLIGSPRKIAGDVEKLDIQNAYDSLMQLVKRFPDARFVLKIDTEGAEYSIIKSFPNGRIPSEVIAIMAEWHYYGPEPIEHILQQNGFKIISQRLNENGGLIYAFR